MALGFALLSASAGAQHASNSAGAEALYEQARALMKQGDYQHACPKFKQSYDLDPGGGTLLNLAECYENQGKFASAWSTFKEALLVAQRDGRSERIEYAKKHLAAVEPKLSKIVIDVASDANEPGLAITLDRAPLGAAAWGVGMPVDPGSHQVTASAPGKASFQQTIEMSGGSSTLQIPKLRPLASGPRIIDHDVAKKPVTDESQPSSGQGSVGYVIGGAGVVALAVGGYFGLHAISKWNERKEQCVAGCTAAARSAGEDAKSAALVSDVGFGIGLIAVGLGSYLLLSAKSPESTALSAGSSHSARSLQVSPALGRTSAGLLLGGTY